MIKQLCWDTYGRRLAVMMDSMHPKAGHVAIFMTHLTAQFDFLGYFEVKRFNNNFRSRC